MVKKKMTAKKTTGGPSVSLPLKPSPPQDPASSTSQDPVIEIPSSEDDNARPPLKRARTDLSSVSEEPLSDPTAGRPLSDQHYTRKPNCRVIRARLASANDGAENTDYVSQCGPPFPSSDLPLPCSTAPSAETVGNCW